MISINDFNQKEQILHFQSNKDLILFKLKLWNKKTTSSNAILYICNELFDNYFINVASLMEASESQEIQTFEYLYGQCLSILSSLKIVGETSLFADESEEFNEIFRVFDDSFIVEYFETMRKKIIFGQVKFSNTVN